MTPNFPDATANRQPPTADSSLGEHFIPIRKSELIDHLAAHLNGNQRNQFLQLCNILSATFHYEFHWRLENLKNAYSLLDPDRDTLTVNSPVSVNACSSNARAVGLPQHWTKHSCA